jgi:DNA repair protein RadC
MDNYQLTFYGVDMPPAESEATPTPAPKPKPAKPETPRVTMIRELPTSEQPVHRLEHFGAGALSTVELLTIATGFDNFEDAQSLLAANDNLAGLARLPMSDLTAIKGIGPTRAARLKATFELGRRLQIAQPAEKPVIKSPADAANLLMLEMGAYEQEHLVTLILDSKNHVLKQHTVYIGSLNTAVVRVGELFREAIRLNAAAILVAHNHPSNDPTPSAEDVYVTRQIVEAGKLVNIEVLDHIVLAQHRFVSLKERGLGF